jgi:hypothetical protein
MRRSTSSRAQGAVMLRWPASLQDLPVALLAALLRTFGIVSV